MIRAGSAALIALSAFLIAAGPMAAETEFMAGGEIDSGAPALTGGGSLEAARISGAFALRGRVESEIQVDGSGVRGYDAAAGTDFSAARDSLVAGLSLDLRSAEEEGTRSASAGISVPLALNGFVASLSLIPSARLEFLDDPSVLFGAEASVSLLAADFVVKPGFAYSVESIRSGGRITETRPSLGLVWYPGLPLSADFSVWWRRTEDGTVTDEYPASIGFSAVPFTWLAVSLQGDALLDRSGFLSYALEATLEYSREREGADWNMSFPFAFSLDWSADGGYATRLSAGMRWRH